jgi:hypothetical protein
MATFMKHIQSVLRGLRLPIVTSLSTNPDDDAFAAQEAVRAAVYEVWNDKQWSFKQREDTITTVASQIGYDIPPNVGEVYIALLSDTPYRIWGINTDLFDQRVPNPTSTGNPHVFTMWEYTAVTNQPTSASSLSVSSSSTQDSTAKIFIKGLVSGEIDNETVTLSGTTPQVTSKSFSKVISVTKNNTTIGRVTITSNAAVVTNLIINPAERTPRIRKTRLYPIPASALTVTFKHYALPPLLRDPNEDTEIPYRWDPIVNEFALSYALQIKGKDRIEERAVIRQLADNLLGQMRSEERQSSAEPMIARHWGDFRRRSDLWSRVSGQSPISFY